MPTADVGVSNACSAYRIAYTYGSESVIPTPNAGNSVVRDSEEGPLPAFRRCLGKSLLFRPDHLFLPIPMVDRLHLVSVDVPPLGVPHRPDPGCIRSGTTSVPDYVPIPLVVGRELM